MKTARSSLLLAAFPFAVLPLTTTLSLQNTPPQDARSGGVDATEALQELAETYGVQIIWDGGTQEEKHDWGWRSWRDAADWEIQAYAPILIEEVSLYPVSLIRAGQVDRIILCRDLWVEAEGVAQHVSGTLDFGTRTLFLSVAYTYKVNNRPKQRRVIHHALFHQLDYVMGTSSEDPAWEGLNPGGFQYGDYGIGGQHDRTSASGLLSEEFPGFLNRYSTGTMADDKADILAYLMVVHHYMEARGREDPVIRAKIEEMKRRLEELDAGMDAGVWTRIGNIRRDVTPYITPSP